MAKKSKDINLRKLFRKKLEYAEIEPDASVNSILMRRLARKEFVRFNPSRFNVYYAGIIIITSVSLGIALFNLKSGKTKEDSLNSVTGKPETADVTYLEIPAGSVVMASTDIDFIDGNINKVPVPNVPEDLDERNLRPDLNNTGNQRTDNSVVPVGIENSISKRGVIKDDSNEKNKLRGGYPFSGDLFEASVTAGCLPLKVRFLNKVNSYDSIRWTFGDGGFSILGNPDWIFDVEGDYNIGLEVFGPNGKRLTYSSVIKVYPNPQVRFEITPDKAILPDDEIKFINYSTNGVSFRWDFGDGNFSDLYEPVHSYSKFDKYNVKLIAISADGCSDSMTVLNAFQGSKYFIEFPNAFIPNQGGASGGFYSPKSDEAAQVFHPEFLGVSEYQLKIFSKLGILLFESNDINIGWDGYFKGELSNPGVYIWKVRGNFRNGEQFIKMGDITLLKN